MVEFEPISRKPGEVIKSEDWNSMQEGIRNDLQSLEKKIDVLREYIDSMQETTTLLNVTSQVGTPHELNEVIPGESSSYETQIVGLITKQWLLDPGQTGEVCRFGIVSAFDSIDYWAGAENGDRKMMEILLDYTDGTQHVFSEVFIHDRSRLRPKGDDNPYVEYLLSPNEYVWYRYRIVNPSPDKEVLTITFRNTDPECNPRVGNVLHGKARIVPAERPTE
jgi:hypothetical protein